MSTQLNYTITDLEPNTEYVVSVVATTLQGRSDVNASLSVSTFPNRKWLVVVAIKKSILINFSIYIQWNLYIKDTLGPAILVLNREVSSSQRLKIH